MAVKHYCNGKLQTLGTPAVAKTAFLPAVPANPEKCPECGVVCREATAEEQAAWKAAYEAKGGVWGKNPTGGEK